MAEPLSARRGGPLPPPPGRVWLVGAGPGDPELLTVRADRLIRHAGIVVHDRLVSPAVLGLVPARARRIDVGKQPDHHPVPQDEINALLIELAREGHDIVRLKGGDPFVFGRGGEELAALRAAGIAVDVVPGITAAAGAAASLGVPLTHRGHATGVRFVTGHVRAGAPLALDWAGLADPDTTLVVYMGLAALPVISAQLIAHGMPPDLPALVVASATMAAETCVSATLRDVPGVVAEAGLAAPALLVIGRVVDLRQPAAEMAAGLAAFPGLMRVGGHA
ncbi:uroporphyrinogen-III C-methyltransferase [Rhodobacteraceae bacterium DSL-40]|uniref:uroporphyrinogen-III C-methyltransferase n=1 Tax=Amaricoccus sp. B4 TaxID=3368557 RepID=UPI000DAD44EA